MATALPITSSRPSTLIPTNFSSFHDVSHTEASATHRNTNISTLNLSTQSIPTVIDTISLATNFNGSITGTAIPENKTITNWNSSATSQSDSFSRTRFYTKQSNITNWNTMQSNLITPKNSTSLSTHINTTYFNFTALNRTNSNTTRSATAQLNITHFITTKFLNLTVGHNTMSGHYMNTTDFNINIPTNITQIPANQYNITQIHNSTTPSNLTEEAPQSKTKTPNKNQKKPKKSHSNQRDDTPQDDTPASEAIRAAIGGTILGVGVLAMIGSAIAGIGC